MSTLVLNANSMGTIFLTKVNKSLLDPGTTTTNRRKAYRQCKKMLVGAGIIDGKHELTIGLVCDATGNFNIVIHVIDGIADVVDNS